MHLTGKNWQFDYDLYFFAGAMKVVYVWNVSAGKYLLLINALLFHFLQSELLTDTIWAE